jgi:hypothetical protein
MSAESSLEVRSMAQSKLSVIDQVCVIELQWASVPMDRSYEEFRRAIPSLQSAVYVFEGKYDSYPTRTVLYVGRTKEANGCRPVESAYDRLYCCAPEMSSCYCDMTLRWAIPPNQTGWEIPGGETTTKILECVLIHAMKPALNSQGVDGWLGLEPWFRRLVICNTGDKGLLLPVIYGDYFARETR